MTRLLFVLPNVEPGDSVRVDTASGSNTPATVYAARGGAVVGPTFHADPAGALPHVYGADGVTTLYLKHLNYKGTVTGSPVTLTGVDDSVAAGGGSGSAASAASLAPTAVKTSAYTASPSDFVPVDTTSGNVTITLPTAPADKTQIGVKHVVRGGTNTVTVTAGGTDKFNVAGGSATASLALLREAATFQYAATPGLWYALSNDLPLSQLDTRYTSVTTVVYSGGAYPARPTGAPAGVIYIGPTTPTDWITGDVWMKNT